MKGQASDMNIYANRIIKQRREINQLIADRSGQPYEKIAQDTERDFFMSAKEAKEYGIVDTILGA